MTGLKNNHHGHDKRGQNHHDPRELKFHHPARVFDQPKNDVQVL
jgi:hypothetical protein